MIARRAARRATNPLRRAARRATNPLRRAAVRLWCGRRAGPPVLAISVPKAGTHLLERCLAALPGMVCYHAGVRLFRASPPSAADVTRAVAGMGGHTFTSMHLAWSPEVEAVLRARGFRVLLLVRDPRDVAVSFAHFAVARRRHPQHALFAGLADDQQRLAMAIAGDPAQGEEPRVRRRFDKLLPWRDHGALLVRFEDLVGAAGGGSGAAQREAIGRIAAHIDVPLDDAQAAAVAARAFSARSPTFRRGRAGGWRQEFTAAHEALAAEMFGDLLVDLGYEQDRAW